MAKNERSGSTYDYVVVKTRSAKPVVRIHAKRNSFSFRKVSLFFSRVRKSVSQALYWGRGSSFRIAIQGGFALFLIVLFIPYVAKEEYVVRASSVKDADIYFSFGGDILASDVLYEFGADRTVIPDGRPDYRTRKYTVQSGDTISSIAAKFEISTDTIRWANSLTGDYIKPGQQLEILPVDGVLHTVKKGETLSGVVSKYKLAENGYSEQTIVDWNLTLEEPYILAEGMTLIVPGAVIERPKPVVVASSPEKKSGGYSTTSGGISAPNVPGMFIKPTAGGVGKLTQRFHSGHKAVDIASNAAPDIVASAGGTVIFSGWKTGGCGNGVWIDHHDGYVSHVCHLESYYVTSGEGVVQGQRIGKMGATGRSTGIHVHFVISYRGVPKNPLDYISI